VNYPLFENGYRGVILLVGGAAASRAGFLRANGFLVRVAGDRPLSQLVLQAHMSDISSGKILGVILDIGGTSADFGSHQRRFRLACRRLCSAGQNLRIPVIGRSFRTWRFTPFPMRALMENQGDGPFSPTLGALIRRTLIGLADVASLDASVCMAALTDDCPLITATFFRDVGELPSVLPCYAPFAHVSSWCEQFLLLGPEFGSR